MGTIDVILGDAECMIGIQNANTDASMNALRTKIDTTLSSHYLTDTVTVTRGAEDGITVSDGIDEGVVSAIRRECWHRFFDWVVFV